MDKRIRVAFPLAACLVAGAIPAAAQALPAGVTQDMVDKGKAIYGGAGMCYACHGKNGEGLLAPTTKLVEHDWIHSKGTYPEIVQYIISGVSKEQAKSGIPMPARGGSKITDDEVKAVAAYVFVMSRKKG